MHAGCLVGCTAGLASPSPLKPPASLQPQVLEVTQVGRARRPDGKVQLYTHTPVAGGGGVGPHAELLAALAAAAANTSEQRVAVSPAGAAAPGLPPTASAGSFVRVGGATLPAVLVSGFDTAFQGSTFHTQYDTLETIDLEAVATAAVVLARAAHALALGGPSDAAAAPLPVSYTGVQATVDALAQVSVAVLALRWRGGHLVLSWCQHRC